MTDAGGRTQMRIRQKYRATHSQPGTDTAKDDGCLALMGVAALGIGLASYFFGAGTREEAEKTREALQKPAQVEVIKWENRQPQADVDGSAR